MDPAVRWRPSGRGTRGLWLESRALGRALERGGRRWAGTARGPGGARLAPSALPQTSALGPRDAPPAGGGRGRPLRCAESRPGAECLLCTRGGREPALQSWAGRGAWVRGEAMPRNSGQRTVLRGRWVRLCASLVVCGVRGSEETLGACGTWSRVRAPCRVWALAHAARGGASGTGSAGRRRCRGSGGDKGFRDAALPGGAAPEPAVPARSRAPSLTLPNSTPLPVVIE